jgi:secreted trypsin-like serine protease
LDQVGSSEICENPCALVVLVARVMAGRGIVFLFTAGVMQGVVGIRKGKKTTPQLSSCGLKKGSPAAMGSDAGISVVNGRPAAECTWPWQIDLGTCGGTLITPEWILSAGHCSYPAKEVAWAGLHNKSDTSRAQRRQIVETHRHPSFHRPEWYSNDLLLLKVDPPFELNECVSTACLPETEKRSGSRCWITGWGTLSTNGPSPEILQEAALDIKSDWDCEDAYGRDKITDDMMCAQGRNNGKVSDSCQGDSGGPMVCESGGLWYVQGATSWGHGCANRAYPGVYARTAFNKEWIMSTMSGR